jgi:putative ABC transport system permease protein
MNVSQIAASALRGITRNKLRSSLMMVGVMVGVGALTVVTAIGKATVKEVQDKVESSFSGNNILITAGGGSRHGAARGEGPTTTLTLDDLEALEARIPNIEMTGPSLRVGGRMVTYKGANRDVSVTGYSEKAESLTRAVVRGSYFTRNDVRSSARVAVIGQDAAQELFKGAEPIGEQVRIGSVPFEIVGVLERGGMGVHGTNTDDVIYVPVTTAMRRLMNVEHISSAKLRLRDAGQMDATEADIERVLRERHNLTGDKQSDFSMITPVLVREMVAASNRIFTLFLPLIAAIAIGVGALIIASLMLVAVNERRPEIGLRKAVGARPKDIKTQFLVESTIITVIAGVLGLAVGAVTSQVILSMQDKPLTLPWGAMLLGLGVSVAVGLLAGAVPASRAAALDPVETLR